MFLHDVQTGETRRINVGWDGRQTTAAIDSPAISMSEDGAFVAFAGDDWTLSNPPTASDDNNDALDVFIYDRAANTLSRVDLGAGGSLGNGHTHWPTLSADGRYVSVVSNATNVANPGSPGRAHVFVYDRATRRRRASASIRTARSRIATPRYSTISADGSVVTFISQATNLPTGAPPDTDTIYAAVHFDVTPLTLTLPARGGEVTATVTAQRYVSWEGRPADWSWLNWGSVGAYGVGNGTASFQAFRNHDPSPALDDRRAGIEDHYRHAGARAERHQLLACAGRSPAGGTAVTFRGSGFEPGMQVYFDGELAQSVEFVGSTRIASGDPGARDGRRLGLRRDRGLGRSRGAPDTFRYVDATPPQIYPWTWGTQTGDGWFTSDVQIEFLHWDPESPIVGSEGCASRIR